MRRAFTLLEVLLGLGLIAALSGGVFAFMWQVALQKTALTGRAMDGQAGDAVLERMESDLTVAVAADSAGNAGIVGTETSLKVLSRAVGLPLTEEDVGWKEGDLQGTEYAVSGGTLTAQRWNAHRNRGGASGTAETVSSRIEAIRFRYYDGEQWVTSFDSKSKDSLPVAIEVAVWFGVPGSAEKAGEAKAPKVERSPGRVPLGAPMDQDGNPLEAETPVEAEEELARPARAPDRVRVMVVWDGPITAWKETR